jgi:mono/diheme cytochrome c family protein
MRALTRLALSAVLLAVLVALAGLIYLRATGLRAQPEPGPLETRIARAVRGLAIPGEARSRTNPLAASTDALAPGLEHFARYCAICHANDGSGKPSALGGGLFPKPPDLGAAATQNLRDGELFYIIENGVRFTGMPAFGTGKPDPAGEQQIWQLVYFIRHLPRITPAELERMASLNPL